MTSTSFDENRFNYREVATRSGCRRCGRLAEDPSAEELDAELARKEQVRGWLFSNNPPEDVELALWYENGLLKLADLADYWGITPGAASRRYKKLQAQMKARIMAALVPAKAAATASTTCKRPQKK